MIRLWSVLAVCATALPAAAQDIRLPGNAVEQINQSTSPDSHRLATGPWDGAVPMTMAEGTVTTTVWRIPGSGLTTLQVLRPLRDQIAAAGYDTLFTCETDQCGGFDFRFAIAVSPPPAMQVDLGDFRYISARRTTQTGEFALSILVSRTGQAGYVQIVQVSPENTQGPVFSSAGAVLEAAPDQPEAGAAQPDSLTGSLDSIGRAVLRDLTFDTGSAQLTDAPSQSLRELADYLLAQPDLTVALVGHTDASGSLDANISLSKRRAGSVLERLVTQYNIPRRQLEAQGMGYLSPVANNRSATGREANRRVEVIITSVE